MTDCMPKYIMGRQTHYPEGSLRNYRFSDDNWRPEGKGWHTYLEELPPENAQVETMMRVWAAPKIVSNARDLHPVSNPWLLFWRPA